MNTLLVMNAPPALEEDLVDYLLSLPFIEGFTSFQANGHGQSTGLNVSEQVTGRQQRIQFEIILAEELAAAVLGGLTQQVGPGITYWQLPVTQPGRS
jgi:hypothetical protein